MFYGGERELDIFLSLILLSRPPSEEEKSRLLQEFLLRMSQAGLRKPNVRRRVWPILLGVMSLEEQDNQHAKLEILRKRLRDLEEEASRSLPDDARRQIYVDALRCPTPPGFTDVPDPDDSFHEDECWNQSAREWAEKIESAEGMVASRKRWATRVSRLLAAAAVADPEVEIMMKWAQ